MLISYTNKEKDLLARIMRAEALNEGELGMMMVGDVIINRCVASCYTFRDVRSITDVIYQKNQFKGIDSSLFQGKATKIEKRLAERKLNSEYFYPATNSLWFCAKKNNSCKNKWYNQECAGSYKNHCFYVPKSGICEELSQ